ncbi:hypothetical protein B0H14DRAFT_2646280 [Mycena olivaceomarginata]|nr:hypothetical protein B0H14DRAFT_2646280 [Mycena olivaceomarginata]
MLSLYRPTTRYATWDDPDNPDSPTRYGNGGNHDHDHQIPLAKVFYLRMWCNVLVGIDVQTMLDYITSNPCFLKMLLSFRILYSQSIGGAAIDLASRNPSKPNFAMPFSSPWPVLFYVSPDMGFGFQSAALPPCNADTRVADELVPKEHMCTLWKIVAGPEETKTAGGVELSKGLERASWTAVADFVADLNQQI